MFRSHTQEVSLSLASCVRTPHCVEKLSGHRGVSGRFKSLPVFAQENILNDVSLAAGRSLRRAAARSGQDREPSDPRAREPSRPSQTGETSAEPSRPIYNSTSHCDERRHRTITGSQSVTVVAAPSPNGRFLPAAEELFSLQCR